MTVYVAGCGPACPCQTRRGFGGAHTVFSTGERFVLEARRIRRRRKRAVGPRLKFWWSRREVA